MNADNKDTTDTDEVIVQIFQKRMEELARSYGLKSLFSYIRLNVYEKRDRDDDTLELHKLNRFQNIKIEYRASFGKIVLKEDILIEEENY